MDTPALKDKVPEEIYLAYLNAKELAGFKGEQEDGGIVFIDYVDEKDRFPSIVFAHPDHKELRIISPNPGLDIDDYGDTHLDWSNYARGVAEYDPIERNLQEVAFAQRFKATPSAPLPKLKQKLREINKGQSAPTHTAEYVMERSFRKSVSQEIYSAYKIAKELIGFRGQQADGGIVFIDYVGEKDRLPSIVFAHPDFKELRIVSGNPTLSLRAKYKHLDWTEYSKGVFIYDPVERVNQEGAFAAKFLAPVHEPLQPLSQKLQAIKRGKAAQELTAS